jgi:hypothetical protein
MVLPPVSDDSRWHGATRLIAPMPLRDICRYPRHMRRWGAIVVQAIGLGLAVAVLITWTQTGGTPVDAWCYYGMDPSNPYDPTKCFLYSPPVAQVMAVIQSLVPFEAFYTAVRVVEMIALAMLSGPAVGLLLAIPAVEIELNAANVNLLLTLAVVAGFRYPWTWAFVILTKLTPGICLLWFAVRREWRNLGIALGVTAVITAISFVVAPWMWFDYIRGLAAAPDESAITVWVRLPLAILVVIWGARKDHRWAMIVAVFLALPRWYFLSPVVLVGLFPLVRFSRPLPVPRFLQRALAAAHGASKAGSLATRPRLTGR